MSAKILEGKFFAAKIKETVKKDVDELRKNYSITPGLAVIIVGNDPASKVYVANKERSCNELGINSVMVRLPDTASKEELLQHIKRLNDDKDVHGILVQLPLPEHIAPYETEILKAIEPQKDVDGFHPENVGKLSIGEESLVPCTPMGCIKMLELGGIDISGKHAVIVGRSNIVGKPMFSLLLKRNATVTVCHSRTQDLVGFTKRADILIAAVGKPRFVTADMVKPGAIVLDVGINRLPDRKLVGDVDFDNVKEIASAITPVPGGIGLLTIAMLMYNTVQAAKMQLRTI